MAAQINKGILAGSFNLTPLIDIIFLLLIFFLVVSRFEQEERDMEVRLPQASAAEPTVYPGREVFVTVTPAGEFYLDDQRQTISELERQLQELHQNNPGRQRVTIRADESSRTAHLVAVINACNRANIREYTIATQ
jgi:biopolymer transport protein ExbD